MKTNDDQDSQAPNEAEAQRPTPDLSFRPAAYWRDATVDETIASSISGTVRRDIVKKAIEEGTVEDLPDIMLKDRLSEEERFALSRVIKRG